MTKKITVDYNQETLNTSATSEQPPTVPKKILKEKQNSVLSLMSQGSLVSQGKKSFFETFFCFIYKNRFFKHCFSSNRIQFVFCASFNQVQVLISCKQLQIYRNNLKCTAALEDVQVVLFSSRQKHI